MEAAIETFRQNAVDLFFDCPSRERAGWLCDSFFTGRVEYLLTGKTAIETGFLENFLHEECYAALPEGMFPMCYPADPYVFYEDGIYTMVYVTENLYYRTSSDLLHWSDERLFQANPFCSSASQESPCLFKKHGRYYLTWCIYDGQNGCYDNRTYVFAANSLTEFSGKTPIAMLKGHAPEIVSENGQDYILSVYYPENGLNIAKIQWE